MNTTIRVNGPHGVHFLALLGAKLAHQLNPTLAPLLDGRVTSLEVDTALAEQLAAQIADVIEPMVEDSLDPPLLFSPNVGDHVVVVRDALFEFQPPARRGPKIWRFTPRGTRGRVIAHEGTSDRVLFEPSQEVAYVRPQSMTGIRYWSNAPR